MHKGRTILAGLIALMITAAPLTRHAPAAAAPAGSGTQITLGNIGWDEDVAVNNVLKVVLEGSFGYKVKLQLADAGLLYQGVSDGSIDAFMDSWLPNTHKIYWARFKDKMVKLPAWYKGDANLGLAVPNYVKAQTIADLNSYRSEFNGQIVGIEAGSGLMNIVKTKVIPGYSLNYALQGSSTPAMLAAVKRAIAAKQPIVFTAWKPHWMFTAYPVHYLKDPKGLLGGTEQVSGVVRSGLAKDAPKAYALISHFSLTEQQLGTLELAIKGASDPEAGARAWVAKNAAVVKAWSAAM